MILGQRNNCWNIFYSLYGSDKKNWDLRSTRGTPYRSKRFLALAYWLSEQTELINLDLVHQGAKELKFEYNFSQCRKGLIEELKDNYNIELLVNKSGDYQYLRTLALYSGKIYGLLASELQKLLKKHSLDEVIRSGFLKKELAAITEKYTSDKNKVEKGTSDNDSWTLDDIEDFFRTLLLSYKEKGSLTVETVQGLAPIPQHIAEEVISKLLLTDTPASNLLCRFIEINPYGSMVYAFPEICYFPADTAEEVTFFVKKFSDSANDTARKVCYKKQGDYWRRYSQYSKFKLSLYKHIEKHENNTVSDVTPAICRNYDMVLFKLKEKDSGEYTLARNSAEDCIIVPGDSLSANSVYKACFFRDAESKVTSFKSRDSEIEKEEKDIKESNGIFRVQEEWEVVEIGPQRFLCKDEHISLSNMSDFVTDPDCKTRCFFSRNEAPIRNLHSGSESKKKVTYSWPGGDTELFNGKKWNLPVPQECLWQKGRLKLTIDDTVKCNRPATFLEPLSLEVSEPIDINKDADIKLKIGNNEKTYPLKKEKTFLEFKEKGFDFRIPVPREGIWFSDKSEQTIIALAPEKPYEEGKVYERKITEIARSDFERLMCCINLTYQNIELLQGNKVASSYKNDSDRVYVRKILQLQHDAFQCDDVSGDYFAIKQDYLDKRIMYKFHLYDPIKCPIKKAQEQKETRCCYKKDGSDLIVQIFCARSDFNKNFFIHYTSPHQQDTLWSSAKLTLEGKKRDRNSGMCYVILRAKEFFFYKDTQDYWRGHMCFITIAADTGKYEMISSGFFIAPPEGSVPRPIEEDKFGLRDALCNTGNVPAITAIMRREDKECQDYLKEFITRLDSNVAKLNRSKNYFNSYRNCLPGRTSGYIFMADHYFKNIANGDIYSLEKNERWENYRGCWDPLMFDYRIFDRVILPELPEELPRQSLKDSLSKLPQGDKIWLLKVLEKYTKKEDRDQISWEEESLSPHRLLAIIGSVEDWEERKKENLVNALKTKPAQELRKYDIFWYHLCNLRSYTSGVKKVQDICPALQLLLSGDYARWLYCIFKEELPLLPFNIYSGRIRENMPCLSKDKNKKPCRSYPGTCPLTAMEEKVVKVSVSIYLEAVLRFLENTGKRLHEWRKNPDLKEGQQLRDELLRLRSIDACLKDCIPLRTIVEWHAVTLYNKENIK